MRTLLLAALVLSACSAADPDEPISGEEIALRYAEAVCDRLEVCNGTAVAACMTDEIAFLRTWYPGGFPEDAVEADVAACEDFVATSPCGTLYFRSDACDFGQ